MLALSFSKCRSYTTNRGEDSEFVLSLDLREILWDFPWKEILCQPTPNVEI